MRTDVSLRRAFLALGMFVGVTLCVGWAGVSVLAQSGERLRGAQEFLTFTN